MGDHEVTDAFNQYIEPSPIPFRFVAPGWWVLVSVLILIVLFISFLVLRHYKRNLYRKQALRRLEKIIHSSQTSLLQLQVYEAAILIKRVAIARYGRNPVAGLSGQEWIDWLNSRLKKTNIPRFDKSDESLVSDGIYSDRNLNSDTVNPFLEKAKNWIRYHHAI